MSKFSDSEMDNRGGRRIRSDIFPTSCLCREPLKGRGLRIIASHARHIKEEVESKKLVVRAPVKSSSRMYVYKIEVTRGRQTSHHLAMAIVSLRTTNLEGNF